MTFRRTRALLMAVTSLAAACTPAPTHVDAVETATPATTTPPHLVHQTEDSKREVVGRRTAIHFERLDDKPFPYPLVRARVRGVDTWLIVDSGASHTVLDRWLVTQLGVELAPFDQGGEGHAGQRVEAMIARSPHLELAEWGPILGGDVLAVALPQLFRHLGLGGVLSPQTLALPGTVVVVDLPASSLRLARRTEVTASKEERSLGEGRACTVGGDLEGVVYLVDGVVQGEAARLVVDSGAARSDLLAESPPGRSLASRTARGGDSYTVAGRVRGRRIPGAFVTVGSVSKRLDVAILPGRPSGACPRDGHLGLDVLRSCVLFLALDHFGAQCQR
jgi:hypothetical protein